MKIKKVSGRKVIDSNASWTIEAKIELEDGSVGIGTSPGGLSRGTYETPSIPGEAAERVISNIIAPELQGREFADQSSFDKFLMVHKDHKEEIEKIGGNTLIALSIAFCRAISESKKIEPYQYIAEQLGIQPNKVMPQMMMLILEGGKHGSGEATIQEFMSVVSDVGEGMRIYNDVKKELAQLGASTNVGSEGAFSPEGFDNLKNLKLLQKHLKNNHIALDIAANSFENHDLPDYEYLIQNFPIVSIEDPYLEDDWTEWEDFIDKFGGKIMVVADDLTTTNPERTMRAINDEVANAIIIKPNQIGTVTETLITVKMAKRAGWKTIVSHRGTDSNDDFVADLAVGINSEYVKFGAPARGERTAKYNRLLEILS